MFEHEGRKTAYSGMAWFVGNMGPQKDYVRIQYIDNLDPTDDSDDSFSTVGQDDIDVITFAITGTDIEEV